MIMKETKNPWNHSIHLPQSFLFVSAGKTNAIAVVGDAGRKANDKETLQVTGCNTRGKQALSITGRNTTGKQTLNMGDTQQVHKLSSLPADARSYTTALSTDNLRNVRCYASFSRLLHLRRQRLVSCSKCFIFSWISSSEDTICRGNFFTRISCFCRGRCWGGLVIAGGIFTQISVDVMATDLVSVPWVGIHLLFGRCYGFVLYHNKHEDSKQTNGESKVKEIQQKTKKNLLVN